VTSKLLFKLNQLHPQSFSSPSLMVISSHTVNLSCDVLHSLCKFNFSYGIFLFYTCTFSPYILMFLLLNSFSALTLLVGSQSGICVIYPPMVRFRMRGGRKLRKTG